MKLKICESKKAGIVSQSTQMIENVQEIINILMQKVYDLRFINTICFPTRRNHEQIKELAVQCDVMIVIGSYTSAILKGLQFHEKINVHIGLLLLQIKENVDNCNSVGISAGAYAR